VYILAQIHAQLGQPGVAFATLDEMLSLPAFHNETWVRRDPGFAALGNDLMFDLRGVRALCRLTNRSDRRTSDRRTA
jgi:hypothetical protein